uniref:P2X purinoreceptor 7 intracellular domain-containing protein n=1 Tax=Cyprinus carpio carpio TaxID=630221 RepID=A0A9J8AHF2_CYPCA
MKSDSRIWDRPIKNSSNLVRYSIEATQYSQCHVYYFVYLFFYRCTCGNCARMALKRENICCREIPQVFHKQVSYTISCMTDHPGLEPVCLNIYSLQNAMNVYRADHGRCRHLSYRWFVNWCWGFLGHVIPSCVVLRIRREFPDAAGQYVGFRPPLD